MKTKTKTEIKNFGIMNPDSNTNLLYQYTLFLQLILAQPQKTLNQDSNSTLPPQPNNALNLLIKTMLPPDANPSCYHNTLIPLLANQIPTTP